jgi:hypothetical protein
VRTIESKKHALTHPLHGSKRERERERKRERVKEREGEKEGNKEREREGEREHAHTLASIKYARTLSAPHSVSQSVSIILITSRSTRRCPGSKVSLCMANSF